MAKINIDVGGTKLFNFLKANYEVPEGVIGFTITALLDEPTIVKWDCFLSEKTQNVTEPLKNIT